MAATAEAQKPRGESSDDKLGLLYDAIVSKQGGRKLAEIEASKRVLFVPKPRKERASFVPKPWSEGQVKALDAISKAAAAHNIEAGMQASQDLVRAKQEATINGGPDAKRKAYKAEKMRQYRKRDRDRVASGSFALGRDYLRSVVVEACAVLATEDKGFEAAIMAKLASAFTDAPGVPLKALQEVRRIAKNPKHLKRTPNCTE